MIAIQGGKTDLCLNSQIIPFIHGNISHHTMADCCIMQNSSIRDYSAWFQHSGVNINQIQQAHGYVSFTELCHVIQNALASSQQPNLGSKIGSSEGLISMGILGFAMQSCKTVADALEIALRYHQVSGSVLNLNFKISEESVELRVHRKYYTDKP